MITKPVEMIDSTEFLMKAQMFLTTLSLEQAVNTAQKNEVLQ